MKKTYASILAPVVLLAVMLYATPEQTTRSGRELTPVRLTASETETAPQPQSDKAWHDASGEALPSSLVTYAISLIGSPYVYGGKSSSGFDCSGFTSYVFEKFEVPITRSSTTQAQDGVPVAREEARPGDLVIFTGTNPDVREPGHVGIVISEPGDTISFVHSSSNGGVKISQVEGTRYDIRFLGIRRLM